MKRIQFLVVLLFCSVFAMAQPPEGGEGRQKGNRDFDPTERAKESVAKLAEKIEISEDETFALEAVITKQMTEMKTMMESGERPSREEMQKKREESNKEIENILGEERYKVFSQMMAERNNKRGKKRSTRKSSSESSGGWR